jgi:hypothetical protein
MRRLEFLVLEVPGEVLPVERIAPPEKRRRAGRTPVLDSLVVIKEADGGIVTAELSDLTQWYQTQPDRSPAHVIGAADVDRVARRLAPGRCALMLLAEQAGDTPPPVTEPSLVDQLAELGELLRRGVLSPGQFEAAKAKLLG